MKLDKYKRIIASATPERKAKAIEYMNQLEKDNNMTQLTFNNQQLLFVRVPLDAQDFEISTFCGETGLYYQLGEEFSLSSAGSLYLPKGNYEYLGTIQKEKGVVSTTIPDEVLEGLVDDNWPEVLSCIYFLYRQMEASGLPLQEGDKYAVLKIK